jgi:hypothetical protein
MTQAAVRRLPLALAVTAALAAVAVWVVFAAPAKASNTFSSGLGAVQRDAKFQVQQSAPYTVAASPKRITRTASAKAGKRLSVSPGRRVAAASGSSELTRARALLAGHIRQHPILKGSTVEFGNAHGHQAICYYKTGRIVISPSHSVSIERIMNHEVWHIIDWRDNGRIDWGENIPPR